MMVLRQAVQEIIEKQPGVAVPGPANELYLLNQNVLTTCTYGRVGEDAHTVNEYDEMESILPMAHVYAATARKQQSD